MIMWVLTLSKWLKMLLRDIGVWRKILRLKKTGPGNVHTKTHFFRGTPPYLSNCFYYGQMPKIYFIVTIIHLNITFISCYVFHLFSFCYREVQLHQNKAGRSDAGGEKFQYKQICNVESIAGYKPFCSCLNIKKVKVNEYLLIYLRNRLHCPFFTNL
jgi:hypothetical protein